jgi:hypothetical protein
VGAGVRRRCAPPRLLTRAGAPAAHAAVNAAVGALAEITDGTVLSGGEKFIESRWQLGELASTVTGTAHGLDDGKLAAALVLRAIAEAAGEPTPSSPSERRALWETVGVTKDQVSGTVMAWGLRPPGEHRWSTMMTDRTEQFANDFGAQYPAVVKLWRQAWPQFIPYLDYDVEVRKVLYTTNIMRASTPDSVRPHAGRGHFPSEQAALKVLYLVVQEKHKRKTGITGRVCGWAKALNALILAYGDRITI